MSKASGTEPIIIEIIGWEKHNRKRNDGYRHHWFKFQNDFFTSGDAYGMSPSVVVLYLYLLCEASKLGTGRFELDPSKARVGTKLKPSKIKMGLTTLNKINKIALFLVPIRPLDLETKEEEENKEGKVCTIRVRKSEYVN